MRLFFSIVLFLFAFDQISYGLGLAYRLNSEKVETPKKTPVLLIHGLVSSKETWEPVINELQKEFGEVWSIDLPGYNESYKIPYKTLNEVQSALANFLQEHKIQSPIVIAHSMGAQLSVLNYKILKPSVLIIEDMDMQQRPSPLKGNLESFEMGFTSQTELLRALAKADYYKTTIDMINAQFLVKENNRFFAKINPYVDYFYRKNFSSNPEVKNAWKALPKDLPILVLQASKGSSTSEHGIRFMQETNKRIKVRKISDSTHSIHKSQGKHFLAAIKNFFGNQKTSNK